MSLEDLQTADVPYNLIRLPLYDRALKTLGRLEPKLHEEVRKSVKQDLESGDLDEIRGTGGWIKGRVAEAIKRAYAAKGRRP